MIKKRFTDSAYIGYYDKEYLVLFAGGILMYMGPDGCICAPALCGKINQMFEDRKLRRLLGVSNPKVLINRNRELVLVKGDKQEIIALSSLSCNIGTFIYNYFSDVSPDINEAMAYAESMMRRLTTQYIKKFGIEFYDDIMQGYAVNYHITCPPKRGTK